MTHRRLLVTPWRRCLRVLHCRALLGLLCVAGTVMAAADLDRMRDSVARRYGEAGVRTYVVWRRLVDEERTQNELTQLAAVNNFINRQIRFGEDNEIWRQVDYWASPLETIGMGAGDCEDFAVAKFFSLVELGVPPSRLRLIYVRARIGGPTSSVTQAHMVLGYYATPDAEPLVLDNLVGEIRPASRRPDLSPVFSFNSEGVFMAGASRPSSPVDRLGRWTELLLRMKGEGYEPLRP